MSNFWQRTITGILFVVVLIGATLFSEWSFLLLLFAINILGLWEYCNLFRAKEYAPHKNVVLILGTVIFLLAASFYNPLMSLEILGQKSGLFFPLLLTPILLTLFIVELYNKEHSPFQRAAVGITGLIYIPISLSYLSRIPYLYGGDMYKNEYEAYIPISIFILIWSSDTFAYLAGRTFGKHKLFPSVSPKKTWEGFIGGIIGTIGISILLYYSFGIFSIPVWIGLAIIISVFGLWGDLIQSMLKRSLELKDSGTILPGHGGILDRFDSLLFCIPFVAAYLYFVV
ncbi:MAG: phosphatidate cytidylyltransferase [Sphingobacteriales bacterium]|nr:MAG: phosphatidate cytidylyltransferase [Sphingobacteriales bacterium]